MNQMMIPLEMQVRIDYQNCRLSYIVRQFKPVVWEEGSSYCCIWGPDLEKGVLGYGNSIEAALADWELNMKKRLAYPKPDDEVSTFIEKIFQPKQSVAHNKHPRAA